MCLQVWEANKIHLFFPSAVCLDPVVASIYLLELWSCSNCLIWKTARWYTGLKWFFLAKNKVRLLCWLVGSQFRGLHCSLTADPTMCKFFNITKAHGQRITWSCFVLLCSRTTPNGVQALLFFSVIRTKRDHPRVAQGMIYGVGDSNWVYHLPGGLKPCTISPAPKGLHWDHLLSLCISICIPLIISREPFYIHWNDLSNQAVNISFI